MRTPKEYTDNLKQGVITQDMIADCLFSVNKRAKNCRDQEYCYQGSQYGDKYRDQKEDYYRQKEQLLSILTPDCIHVETQSRKERIYNYESEYDKYYLEHNYVHEGGYYDREMKEYVEFIDVICPVKKHYLFYDLGSHSFHTPIEEYDLQKYPHLDAIEIDQITTYGQDIVDLISMQFVKKVLQLINGGTYTLK